MKTIWKFPLALTDTVELTMPKGAIPLYVDVDNKDGRHCMWALVKPSEPAEIRRFHIYGTGRVIDDNIRIGNYITSWQQDEFVWHIFEE
jgi:hypothetical protein